MKKPGWCFRQTGFRESLLRAILCASILITPATFAQDSPVDIFDALQVMRLPDPPLAPTFALTDVDGGMHKLEDYRGKVVFLNFWTTWCPHCRSERPALQALYEKYQHDGLVVLAISLDRTDIAFIRQFVASQELTFPTLHDPSTGIGSEYGVRGVPATYFIDPEGRVQGVVIGPREWNSKEADQLVQQLLQDVEGNHARE